MFECQPDWRRLAALLFVAVTAPLGGVAAREPVRMASQDDSRILQSFLKHSRSCVSRVTPEAMAKVEQPEDICWTWSHYARMPLAAYCLTGEEAHLDDFVKVMDALLTRLRKGPDGYLGFRGLPLPLFRDKSRPNAEIDVDIAEFEVAHLICDFVTTIREENSPGKEYADAAGRFLDVAEKHLAGAKWESRKWYVDLGKLGAVFRMPAECGNNRDSLTNPHNKQSKMCRAYLALYRVTGKDEYFKRAVRLGIRFKHTLRLDGDKYRWHYWDPAGDWDRKPAEPQSWKHWVGPEHRGGYHALTVAMAESLYDHGVVFDRTDMQRFVNTQMTVCWNGSCESPTFCNTDGRPMDPGSSAIMIAPALARFEPKVREFCFGERATRQRLQRLEHNWQGGVLAIDYLRGKYLGARSEEASQTMYRRQFVEKPENAAFLKEWEFTR